MLEKNWVKNYRKIEEWRYYKKPEYAHLWQHLIRKARFKDCYNTNGQLVKRGQVDFSIRQLENETGVGVNTVRNILKKLEMNTEICTVYRGRNRKDLSIITIVNYEKYQEPLQRDTQQNTQQAHSSNTVTTHQAHNSKNEKNEQNEKNESMGMITQDGKSHYKILLDFYNNLNSTLTKINMISPRQQQKLKSISENMTAYKYKELLNRVIKTEWYIKNIKEPKIDIFLSEEILIRSTQDITPEEALELVGEW